MIHANMTKMDLQFREYYLNMLENIKKNGYYKLELKNSFPKRWWSLFNLGVCTFTCCAPCCIRDTLCCCVSNICCTQHKWMPTYCAFANHVLEGIYEKKNKIVPHTRLDVSPVTVMDVCKTYLIEFDMAIARRTAFDARIANSIRETVVNILQQYHMHRLKDDGDVDKLRTIVYSISPST